MEGKNPCIGRGGKAEVNLIRIEKEEKTRYLGLERGRKEQSRDKELKKSKLKNPRSMLLEFTREAKRTEFGNAEHLMAAASLGLRQSSSAAGDLPVYSREMCFIFE